MAIYRIYFRDDQNLICGREDFEAESDRCAIRIGSRLFDACSDTCSRYELFQGDHALPLPVALIDFDDLTQRHQQVVLQTEEILRRSQWRVARSRRLIDRLDQLKHPN